MNAKKRSTSVANSQQPDPKSKRKSNSRNKQESKKSNRRKSDEKPGLALTKPKSFHSKPLKADFSALFRSIGGAVISGAVGNLAGVAQNAINAAAAIGLKQSNEEIAWTLLQRALLNASLEVISEFEDLMTATAPSEGFDFNLGDAHVDAEMLRNPLASSFFGLFKNRFSMWLQSMGLNEDAAKRATRSIDSNFLLAIDREWKRNPDLSSRLSNAIESPFTSANERERLWHSYAASLSKQIDERMFAEPFGLRDVYIPLRGYYVVGRRDKFAADDSVISVRGIPFDLSQELSTWAHESDKPYVRVLSGGPGAGKSSFCKIWCESLSRTLRTVLIPLHRFDLEGDLLSSLRRYCEVIELLPNDLFENLPGDSHIVLVFDGLDEVSKQGKLATESALNFIREVDRTVTALNLSRTRVKVLISGRPVAIETHESEFREQGQIVHLLSYAPADERDLFRGEALHFVAFDQRDEWWAKYGELTGRDFAGLPEALHRQDLSEITSQPLLNYMLALSFTRGKVDFSNEVDRNIVYADLIEAVWDRDWAEGPKHPSTRDLAQHEFRRVLEQIAIATWHGDGRTVTVRSIEERCSRSSARELLNIFNEGAASGVTRMLTAFYFRHAGTANSERTFEFTHKSFCEYLVSSCVLKQLKRIGRELMDDDGWDVRESLERWTHLCGSSPLTEEIAVFLRSECELISREDATQLQTMLIELIEWILSKGLPNGEAFRPASDIFEIERISRNAEEALLVALNAVASRSGKLSKIKWRNERSAATWLSKLFRLGSEATTLAVKSLSNLSFDGQNLRAMDLTGLVARNSSFECVNLESCCLEDSVLCGANLQKANLQFANLFCADFADCNLEETQLTKTHCSGANFTNASLRNARFTSSDLDATQIEEAER